MDSLRSFTGTLASLICLGGMLGYQHQDTPIEVTPGSNFEPPNSAELAKSLNRYIALGEAKAVDRLLRAANGKDKRNFREYEPILMMRLLYKPKSAANSLRPPAIGAFYFPYSRTQPQKKDWPLLPFVEQDGVYSCLSYQVNGWVSGTSRELHLVLQESWQI